MDFSNSDRPTVTDEVFTGVVQCGDSNVVSENILPIPIHDFCWVIDKRKEVETTDSSSFKYLQLRSASSPTQVTELRAKYAAIFEKVQERSEKRKRLKEVLMRYIKNPEDLATLLNKSVQDLREEIETLKLHCQHIRTLAQPSEPANDVWRTAAEYFRLIRHGLRLDINQLGFMRNTMAPDVVFNAEYGPEVIMQHWFFVD
ncbi:hypothetical protein PI126_g6232 [Phytophthora idaei]|nr:hypothetical protein PI126_g6232 [Phytophthora idaei]